MTWAGSMSGFGNAAKTWWNSGSDYNYGMLKATQYSGHSSLTLGNTDLTIEFWMKPQYSANNTTVLKKYWAGLRSGVLGQQDRLHVL